MQELFEHILNIYDIFVIICGRFDEQHLLQRSISSDSTNVFFCAMINHPVSSAIFHNIIILFHLFSLFTIKIFTFFPYYDMIDKS
ncbi:MAG: hypothetical protein RHS_2762 [Robinsoniella sp. RHS]|nr:MAG: hypothetical protein RHS_2762 [Robinsoniella sp. RHS]